MSICECVFAFASKRSENRQKVRTQLAIAAHDAFTHTRKELVDFGSGFISLSQLAIGSFDAPGVAHEVFRTPPYVGDLARGDSHIEEILGDRGDF